MTRRCCLTILWLTILVAATHGVLLADDEEERVSYGPSDDEPRGTLFQWSYGTSFSGGPDRDEPIVTDRPDFTEASVTVGKGVVQLETGYTYSYDGASGLRGHSYPESLFRIGILEDWLEFRIALNHSSGREGGAAAATHFSDESLYLGFKIALTPQEGWFPEMAIVPQMVRPASTGGTFLPGVNWLYGWDITEKIATGGSTQYNRDIDGTTSRLHGVFAQSWTINFSLTEKLGLYTEWFCLVPAGSDTEHTQHYFDSGFTYLVNNDLQLDIRAGVGASESSDDYFLGTGFSVRF